MTGTDPSSSDHEDQRANEEAVDEVVEAREALEIEALAHELRRARGFRVAARRALVLARRYREEEGPKGDRELACVKQALAWRVTARDLRRTYAPMERPGIARTSVPPSASDGRRAG